MTEDSDVTGLAFKPMRTGKMQKTAVSMLEVAEGKGRHSTTKILPLLGIPLIY